MFRRLTLPCLVAAMLTIPSMVTAQLVPRTDTSATHRADPSPATILINEQFQTYLPFDDDQDFLDAQRGLIAPLSPLRIDSEACVGQAGDHCTAIWDLEKYTFLNPHITETQAPSTPYPASAFLENIPDSVNPSLWRNAVLNTFHGVFKVREDIYQVRGYDLSNMSAIVGKTGWIIVDPLTAKETAKQALINLNRAYTQDTSKAALPVSAIIFTHSHVDHFGGVEGLAEGGQVLDSARVYASEGFLEEAVSENVIVGNAMGRRATYMYGPLLQKGERGQVDGGLGKTTPSGTTGIRDPDCVIGTGTWTGDCSADFQSGTGDKDGLVVGTIDGVKVEFQNVPGSEAPAEMLFYFPDLNALCASEDVTHTFHNVLTLRGANVRDSILWAKYLHKTLAYFADADVVFASHHWPTWNHDEADQPYDTDGDGTPDDRVAGLIELQRDLYRYIHDQSVRLTNRGHTIQEVGEMVKLPPSLGKRWPNRSYYGTVNHNAKAVYQRYIGWFDGNPASLHQLPPAIASRAYVRYMGGAEAILENARTDYEAGHYRWVAMVLNHVVLASDTEGDLELGTDPPIYDPAREARELLAMTYDQLGYQAESGPWRNFYLTGAMELRNGVLPLPAVKTFTRDTVRAMDLEMIFDFVAVHLNGLEAGDLDFTYLVELRGPDLTETTALLYLKNGVLNFDIGEATTGFTPTATLKMTRAFLNDLVMGENENGEPIDRSALFCRPGVGVESVAAKDCIITDNQSAAEAFFSVLDSFDFWFPIVTP